MKKKYNHLIGKIIGELIENNVNIHLKNSKKISENNELAEYNGWFNSDPLEFVIAASKNINSWLPILLHEYCHFRQWIEKYYIWTEIDKFEKKHPIYWNEWLTKKIEYNPRIINKWIRLSRDLELDCEKRTVEFIKQEQLDINIEQYIQGANTYILFYNVVAELRKWYKGTAPYEVIEISSTMPPFFLDNYDKCPKGFKKLVIKYCL